MKRGRWKWEDEKMGTDGKRRWQRERRRGMNYRNEN